jgi:pimeloyl-ACP methyl ester carboxylesterase
MKFWHLNNRTIQSEQVTEVAMAQTQNQAQNQTHSPTHPISYKQVEADGVQVFYREAGSPALPTLLLLHGFPSSSHQFRQLIPLLAERFHIVAPDLPGFGFTQVPDARGYVYSFDALAQTLEAFVDVLGFKRYAMYVFDYGAPVGLRLAVAHPERVTGLVSQNGNAYLEGLGDAWAPIRAYWDQPSAENRRVIHDAVLNLEGTRWQYVHGVSNPEAIAPESYTLDALLLERPGTKEIQLDLFLDYANNLKRYPDFQAFFRQTQLPTLAIWGKHDPFFIPPGAEAFKRDNPNAVVELLDTGHFALETHVEHIARRIVEVIG